MKSIKGKLAIIMGALFLILLIAVGSTLYTVALQKGDAVVINIAGRQSMLTQKMTKEVHGILRWYSGHFLISGGEVEKYKNKLKETMELFDISLEGLIRGDVELGLPGTRKPEILIQMDTVKELWMEFKEKIEVILAATDTDDPVYRVASASILDNNEILLREMNKAVKMYEIEASKKVDRLIQVLVIMVILSLVAFGTGWFLVGYFISRPIKRVVDAGVKIADGDFSEEIDIESRDEIGTLANTFREMVLYLRGMAKTAGEIADGDLRGEVLPKSEKDILGNVFREMVLYLRGMAKTAGEIADGDLRADITPKSDRDVLGNAFKKMLDGLRGIVTEVKAGSNQIASASTGIASASEQASRNSESSASAVEEATAAMHEMSVNIQNVAKNTQSQSTSAAETSASIEEMVTSIQRVAETAQQLVDLSQKTKKAVGMGLEAVDRSVKGTDDIRQTIVYSADTIAALGARTEDIGRIVDVIDDIAEQTNLLALNAAIEAARAGEQGLGFAIVAEEVRKLAERSAKSTKEIADLISSIQKEAQGAVKLMDKSTHIVEKGVELSRQVGGSLSDIEVNVDDVDRYAREIGAATQEQSSGSIEVAKATENLRELTHEISSAADEQASSAEQIVNTMEKMREMVQQNASGSMEIADSAERLKTQGERFQEIVGRFVLNGSEKTETGFDKKDGFTTDADGNGGSGLKNEVEASIEKIRS